MSAWIVSKKHIDVLISFAADHQITVEHHGWKYDVALNPDRCGLELWAENHRSVNHRYQENTPCPEYHWTPDLRDEWVTLKTLNCYDYQACECDDYPTTWSAAFVKALQTYLEGLQVSDDHPRYEAAPWGID